MSVMVMVLYVTQLGSQLQNQTVNGRPVVASQVEQGGHNPQPGIGPGWHTMNPIRPGYYNPQFGKLLSDIESMLRPNHGYEHRDDLTIWAHEATHGVNSRGRQALPPRFNAFYC